jgi:hypothetical protein
MISHRNRTTIWDLRGPVVQIYNIINIFPDFSVKVTNHIENYGCKDSQESKAGKLGPRRSESVGPYEQKGTVYG